MNNMNESNLVTKMRHLNQQFDSALATSGIRPESRDFIRMAVDPFHDTPLTITGSPDSVSGRSLVYDVRRQLTITRPDNLSENLNWDCHVAFIPAMIDWASGSFDGGVIAPNSFGTLYTGNPSGTSELSIPVGNGHYDNSTTFPSGGPFFWSCSQSGVATFDPGAMIGGLSRVYSTNISDGMDLSTGNKFRVIAGAFEVHDTTAEIYRQGSVTCYRTPQEIQETFIALTDRQRYPLEANCPVTIVQGPPSHLAQAKQLDGITWQACEGALVPCQISFPDNTPAVPDGRALVVSSTAEVLSTGCGCFAAGNLAYISNPSDSPPLLCHNSSLVPVPGTQSGAFFAGLHPNASLTLSIRAFIEVFPSPTSTLYPLARPTPKLDSNVAPLLDNIFSQLQPGYPVNFNAKGDFFKKIVSTVSKAYKTAMPMVIAGLSSSADPRLQAAAATLTAADTLGTTIANLS